MGQGGRFLCRVLEFVELISAFCSVV
jgi:hypothetical protein